MRKPVIIGAATVAILLYSCQKENNETSATTPDPDACAESARAASGDAIPGQYIVAFNSTVQSKSMTADNLRDRTATMLGQHTIPASRIKKVITGGKGIFVANLSSQEAATLATDAAVDLVEPDRVIALATCFTIAEPRTLTWNIKRVGYGNGIGKTAWVIDTGIDFDHPDLTVDATRSRSFIEGISSADDENGHGTHVAGIIGGKNNTVGVVGVASGATLISLRVLDAEGNGLLSDIIEALTYVNSYAKAGDVVNMSLGEDVSSNILIQQVKTTASKGIYIAIAAGNDAQPANKYSPANANGTNIYTVSAVDSLDRFASFSNYGNDVVDFAAPGVRILSTYSNGRYAYLSGTSMAAPHVAGLLLLRGASITSQGTALNDPDGVPDPVAHY